jgi:pre-mRNA-processing factor 6
VQEHQNQVIEQCIAADPHHGIVWQPIAKDMANFKKSTQEILVMVARQLQ